jgi:hypothetical protein
VFRGQAKSSSDMALPDGFRHGWEYYREPTAPEVVVSGGREMFLENSD